MRPHGALVPVLGLLWIACCWTPAQAADAPPFAGTVRDTLGRVLEDVEILFARIPSETFRPTAVARTDPHGQFRLAGLAPGLYRVAALKRGYRTFVGQVDTLVRRPLELVLHPAEELDAASLPRDASWALRLPRRGMLHETDARPVDERAEMRPSSAPSSRDELSLELEQYFSVGAAAVESDTEDADIQASETSMRLASSLGERGTIRVAGRRERLGNPEMRGTNDAAASQHGAAVSLDLSYDTSPDGQLAVSAYFNQTDYALAALDPSGPSALQQQQETWGYDARWSRQIDERQRFAVGVGYRDASLAGPWRPALAGLVPALARDAAPVEMFHRAMRAEGSYASVLADGHDLEVSVRARMLRTPEPTPFDPSPVSEGAASWMVEADAQDTWAVSAPFSLVYGLGYRHSLVDRDAMLVAPRVGGRLQAGGVSVSALVSYHTSAGSGRRGAPEVERPFRPGNSLGYRAEVEFPLAYQVRLRGGVSYSPIQLEYFGYLHGDDGLYEHPLYLTDGNTAVTERSLTLTEERGGGSHVRRVHRRARRRCRRAAFALRYGFPAGGRSGPELPERTDRRALPVQRHRRARGVPARARRAADVRIRAGGLASGVGRGAGQAGRRRPGDPRGLASAARAATGDRRAQRVRGLGGERRRGIGRGAEPTVQRGPFRAVLISHWRAAVGPIQNSVVSSR